MLLNFFHLISSFGTEQLNSSAESDSFCSCADTNDDLAQDGGQTAAQKSRHRQNERDDGHRNVESEGKYQQVSRNLMKSKRSVCLRGVGG